MSIDLQNESTISLSQAARLLPPGRRGRPVTISCVLRWVLDGVKTPNGIVRLAAVRMGGRWLTSLEALQRFAEAQTPKIGDQAQALPRSPAARSRASERAERELEKIGI